MASRITIDFKMNNKRSSNVDFFNAFNKAVANGEVKTIYIASTQDGVFLPDGSFVRFDDPSCPVSLNQTFDQCQKQ
jgi:hypothetical protein